jgi:ATP-dependent RNA helicase DDX19/DBP5
MEASDRDAVVNEFREGVTKILIATDVLSRGFDVSQVGGGVGAGVGTSAR